LRIYSPLRYPGGKSILANFLADIIDLNDLRGCAYYEPFAGGAGAALNLLINGIVNELFINDADVRIFAFWNAALNQSERFIEQIHSVPLTIEEWRRQRIICDNPKSHVGFEVGFAAFYMNRCNRSGVLLGAGPIGGQSQDGPWRMDVRFHRENLISRILQLKKLKENVHISCSDAVDFLKYSLPRGQKRKQVFVYLDPPYVNKGQRLYMNAYEAKDHKALADYMIPQRTLHWVMSYDESDLVVKLYNKCRSSILPIRYSLQMKRTANELIIAPNHIAMPAVFRLGHNESLLRKVA